MLIGGDSLCLGAGEVRQAMDRVTAVQQPTRLEVLGNQGTG